MDIEPLLQENRVARLRTEALLNACATYLEHLKDHNEPIPDALVKLIKPGAVNWILVHAWIKGNAPEFAAEADRGAALF